MLKATGATYAAEEAAMQRHIDDQVNQLKRLENAEIKGSKRQLEIHAEVIAAQAAGGKTMEALRVGTGRDSEIAERDAGQGVDVANLEYQGRHQEARRKEIKDRYENEAQKIIEAKYDPKTETSKLHAAEMQRDASNIREDLSVRDRNKRLGVETADAAAQARGQHGVGEVLALKEKIAEMERDAGDDNMQQSIVADFRQAKVDEYNRKLRPQSHVFDAAEYHDALQSGISSGQSSNEARRLLNGIGRDDGGNAGDRAADKLDRAADKLLRAKMIGVIGK